MNILVTGGAGFIGSHVTDSLIEIGHKITVVDNLSTGFKENISPYAEFINVDIRDEKIEEVFANGNFDTVYHLAAQMDVRFSVQYPLEDLSINVAGSLRLMDLCRKYNVGKFIFASTGGAIYGEQDYFPAKEDHPTRPVSPYGVSKLSVESYLYYFHHEFGLNAIALRFANIYGPRQNPHGEAGVVAIFCKRLLSYEQAYVYGDGLQTRDYVFVGDIARANVAALSLTGFNTINLGTGIETDVITLFDKLNKATGSKMVRQHKSALPGEQRRSCIDNELAKHLLAWVPVVDLDVGLARTLEFFAKRSVDRNYR